MICYTKQQNWLYNLFVLQGFDNHILYEHNMWNYVYYSVYLDSIDISDHTAIQKYVYEMVTLP